MKRKIIRYKNKILKVSAILFLATMVVLSGASELLFLHPPKIEKAQAATFQMQTGQYVGNGAAELHITGLGFRPDMVILKADTVAGTGAFMKTNSMPELNSASLLAAADTATMIKLDADGFTVIGTNSNTINVRHTWVAFTGSDCSETGVFCTGSYTGTGATIPIFVGFQPDLVIVKRTTNTGTANWRSSAMGTNAGQYFTATTQDTTGTLFTTLDTTGFTVGPTNSVNANVYHYVAFKSVAGSVKVGTYTGNATDNTNITGVGFVPDFVFTKNANAATPVGAVYNVTESYGDYSSYFTDTANTVDAIQALQTDGFQVGTNAVVNGSGNTIYYAAFGGAAAHSSSGTYQMTSGTYTGTGQYKTISGLGFAPDLVIIKREGASAGVFRTSMMGGDTTAYLDAATANLTGAITSLTSDGFTVYTNATTNTSGQVYHWQAFGNAWDPVTNSGASDFVVGSYTGNGIDLRDITGIPFQPDMVSVKSTGAQAGTFRTSAHTGDLSSFYLATAEAANNIQALNTDGFEVGTAANVNTGAVLYHFFGFKESTRFDVGSYTGNGSDARSITGVGFQPDLVFVKDSAVTNIAVMKPSTLAGDMAQYFDTTAQAANIIQALETDGFQVGTSGTTNTNTSTYRYVAWKKSSTYSAPTPVFKMQTGEYIGNGNSLSISGLGFRPEMVILKPDTATGSGAFMKTSAMPELNSAYLASNTADTTALIKIDADGFTVSGTNANTANIRHTWVAFAGSDCSAAGVFCVGSYTGTAAALTVTTGFQPDLAIVKNASTGAPTWRSSAMGTNAGQYFTATTQDTTGVLFTTIGATGFTVGATNSATGVVHYYAAFKNVAGSINVGTYTGNATDNTNITGVGFVPDFVFVKNANAAVAVSGVYNVSQSYGDYSSYFTDTANVVDAVQALQTDGFQIGTHSTVNGSGNTIYYAAFGGAAAPSSSGTYQMTSGTYVGTGQYKTISGLGFAPDLVIIKRVGASTASFRTSMMGGDTTAYLDAATADFTGGITSLTSDGFTVYTNAMTNTVGGFYHWQAFGNAWDPVTNSGASDFVVGAYTGNGIDTRDITGIPFQPDMVTIKRGGASAATFKTAAQAGDLSGFFLATAEAANNIQALNTDGFEVGTAANVNTAASINWYFGFKEGANFDVGSYTGDGTDNRSITGVGFKPTLVWVKDSAITNAAVLRPDTITNDMAQYFTTTAQAANIIQALETDGFQVGTSGTTNTNTSTYRYMAWKRTDTPQISKRILIDFGGNGATSSPPGAQMASPDTHGNYWNNFAANGIEGTDNPNGFYDGLTFTNLIDTTNTNQGITFTITNSINDTFVGGGSTRGLNTNGTTTDVGDYGGAATQDSNFSDSGTTNGQYTFSGLDSTKTYNFKIWGSRLTGGATDARYLEMKKSTDAWSSSKSFNGSNNTNYYNAINFTGITGVSSLTFDIRSLSGSQFGYIGVIDIDVIDPPVTVFTQSGYRLFGASDALSVPSSLAALNTFATLSNSNADFRLRMLMHMGTNALIQSGQNFKLQFAERSGTCDTAFTGETYADVTPSTLIAFRNNPNADHGTVLTTHADDPTHSSDTIVSQTYVESNNFTNSIASIPAGQDGKWDFSLYDKSTSSSIAYCFRIVKADGGLLDTYSSIPEIVTAPYFSRGGGGGATEAPSGAPAGEQTGGGAGGGTGSESGGTGNSQGGGGAGGGGGDVGIIFSSKYFALLNSVFFYPFVYYFNLF